MWANRAAIEWLKSEASGGRTWFVTLTFKPEEHFRLVSQSRKRLADGGVDLDGLDWRESYAERLKEYHRELDLFFARMRKGLKQRGWKPLRFRYLAVPEPHKNGYVHYHVLIHELSAEERIVRRRIEEAWHLGFIATKLVETREACVYTTKYLGKNHYEGRIRPSRHYGKPLEVWTESEGGKRLMHDWLWARESDAAAASKGDVIDETEEVPVFRDEVKKPRDYGSAPPISEEERAMRSPPVPPMEAKRVKPGEPPMELPAAVRLELHRTGAESDPEAAEPVLIGEYLGVCPMGLHIGRACDCETPTVGEFACDEAEIDQFRGGVPLRKWPLRGWHSPRKRGADP